MSTDPSTAMIPLRRLAVAPYDLWTYEDIARAVKDELPLDYEKKYNYSVLKNHYQAGKEWVGPGTAGDLAGDKIKSQFAPEDAIGEALSNVSNAFSEPQIGFASLAILQEGEKIDDTLRRIGNEGVSLISNWWDKRRMQEHVQERQALGAWSGSAMLRYWIPSRFMLVTPEGGINLRGARTVEEALNYLFVSAPMPDSGRVLTHPATQDLCAVFLDSERRFEDGRWNEYKRAEMVFLDPNRDTDEDADTIIRIVYSDPKRKELRTAFQLGGRLMASEMRVPPLVTDPVLRTQRQLNFLSSLITRMAETAAFRERYITNSKPQGVRIPYNEGDELQDGSLIERDEEGREWAVIPQERTLGASTTTELVGLEATNEVNGNLVRATPSITVVDPVDPTPYINAVDATRRRLLRMCAQGHLGGVSNVEASGIAYEQARAVFEKDLNRRRVAEEGMLLDFLTSVLRMAETIAGTPGYYTDKIRLTVDQHIDPGPRSPDLVRLDMELYEAGVRSLPTTMALVGTEDVNAEIARVSRSVTHILEVLEKTVSSATVFTPESIVAVLQQLGLPPEVVSLLVAKPPEPPKPIGAPNEG